MTGTSSDDGLLTFHRHLSDAARSEPSLPPSVRAEIHHRFRDLLAGVKEALVKHWDPQTLIDARGQLLRVLLDRSWNSLPLIRR
jgi:hypothetical protein